MRQMHRNVLAQSKIKLPVFRAIICLVMIAKIEEFRSSPQCFSSDSFDYGLVKQSASTGINSMEWTAFVIAPQPDVGRHDVDVERDEKALPAVLQQP